MKIMNPDISAENSIESMTIERIDDIPLLLGLQQKIGLDVVIDNIIPRHWLHQGLSLGQLVLGWNAFILSEGNHRKVSVRDWAFEHRLVLEELIGCPIRDTDFTDDRLGQVLCHLSDDESWEQLELSLWENSVAAYSLRPERVRLDATTANGYHTVTDEGLMQHGYNAHNNHLPQVKVMVGSTDIGVNGHLVATEVVPGQNADDPLYVPVIQRLRNTLKESGLLYLGDSKMGALSTRADIVAHGDFYLVPLAKVGETKQLLGDCVETIVAGEQTARLIFNHDQKCLIASGYETTVKRCYTSTDGKEYSWDERLLVIRSQSDAKKQMTNLNKRLQQATQALLAATPEPGRGHKQIKSESQLRKKAEAILQDFGVSEYLAYTFQREESSKTQYIGRGRGGPSRPKRAVTEVRYQITKVCQDELAIQAAYWRMGWRLYVTNQDAMTLPLDKAILLYRQAPKIERHFHLFKDAPIGIEPLFVRRDEQIKGLVRLLSLCVRFLTLIEIVVRRNLAQSSEKLSGLYEGNPKRQTEKPTATRLLKAFGKVSRVRLPMENQTISYITPLSPLQKKILALLELSEAYEVLLHNSG
jgi:transposase